VQPLCEGVIHHGFLEGKPAWHWGLSAAFSRCRKNGDGIQIVRFKAFLSMFTAPELEADATQLASFRNSCHSFGGMHEERL